MPYRVKVSYTKEIRPSGQSDHHARQFRHPVPVTFEQYDTPPQVQSYDETRQPAPGYLNAYLQPGPPPPVYYDPMQLPPGIYKAYPQPVPPPQPYQDSNQMVRYDGPPPPYQSPRYTASQQTYREPIMAGALPAPEGRPSGSGSFQARMQKFSQEERGSSKNYEYGQESRPLTSQSYYAPAAIPPFGDGSGEVLDARIRRLRKRERELKEEIETGNKEAKQQSNKSRHRLSGKKYGPKLRDN